MNESTTSKRRYLRFRLRTLLMLPVLVAASWWWWTWPERTARRFVDLLNDGDVEGAKAMIDGPQPSAGFWKIVSSGKFNFDAPVFEPTMVRDHLTAWRAFHFDWRWKSSSDTFGSFVADRNRVKLGAPTTKSQMRLFFALRSGRADSLAKSFQAVYPEGSEYRFRADQQKGHLIVLVPQYAFGEISALTLLFESEQPP
jgi:hypothetical protein